MDAIGRFHKLQRWPQTACFHQAISYFISTLDCIFFLLACLAPYLNPQKWWFISFLGIGFPFLLVAVILFMLWWLFVKRKFAIISALALLLGIKSISVFFAFHFTGSFDYKKNPGFDTDCYLERSKVY